MDLPISQPLNTSETSMDSGFETPLGPKGGNLSPLSQAVVTSVPSPPAVTSLSDMLVSR
jgi:hypothetical protein